MQLHNLEGGLYQVLVNEAHCLDPVGKDQNLGQVPLANTRCLHATASMF